MKVVRRMSGEASRAKSDLIWVSILTATAYNGWALNFFTNRKV